MFLLLVLLLGFLLLVSGEIGLNGCIGGHVDGGLVVAVFESGADLEFFDEVFGEL